MFRLIAAVTTLASVAVSAQPQHSSRAPAPAAAAPAEAGQFDFLIGQWDLVVRPKVNSLAAKIHGAPRLLGTWKAWKAMDALGLEDELRIIDGSGNPSSLTHALRIWSSAERRWLVTTADAYRGRVSSATAVFANGEMELTGRGTDPSGKAVLTRSRFQAITPTTFRFRQDRSSDEGKSWDEGVLVIEAKRVATAAPR